MIRDQIESNLCFAELFSFVRFEFLSVESIEDFISWSCQNFECFEHFFSQGLWSAICGRLCLCLSHDIKCQNQRYCIASLHFVPKSDSPLVGIIAYLTAQHGGNVHDQGIVNVSVSTTDTPFFLPRMPLICFQLLISSRNVSRINGFVMISKIVKFEQHTIQSGLIPIIGICVRGSLKGQWMVQDGQNWIVTQMIRPRIRIIQLEHFQFQNVLNVNLYDFVKRV
jgi:hypothetical protein